MSRFRNQKTHWGKLTLLQPSQTFWNISGRGYAQILAEQLSTKLFDDFVAKHFLDKPKNNDHFSCLFQPSNKTYVEGRAQNFIGEPRNLLRLKTHVFTTWLSNYHDTYSWRFPFVFLMPIWGEKAWNFSKLQRPIRTCDTWLTNSLWIRRRAWKSSSPKAYILILASGSQEQRFFHVPRTFPWLWRHQERGGGILATLDFGVGCANLELRREICVGLQRKRGLGNSDFDQGVPGSKMFSPTFPQMWRH